MTPTIFDPKLGREFELTILKEETTAFNQLVKRIQISYQNHIQNHPPILGWKRDLCKLGRDCNRRNCNFAHSLATQVAIRSLQEATYKTVPCRKDPHCQLGTRCNRAHRGEIIQRDNQFYYFPKTDIPDILQDDSFPYIDLAADRKKELAFIRLYPKEFNELIEKVKRALQAFLLTDAAKSIPQICTNRWKLALCTHGVYCSLKEKCTFVHSILSQTAILSERLPSYKSKPCEQFLIGDCKYGENCHKAHPGGVIQFYGKFVLWPEIEPITPSPTTEADSQTESFSPRRSFFSETSSPSPTKFIDHSR